MRSFDQCDNAAGSFRSSAVVLTIIFRVSSAREDDERSSIRVPCLHLYSASVLIAMMQGLNHTCQKRRT